MVGSSRVCVSSIPSICSVHREAPFAEWMACQHEHMYTQSEPALVVESGSSREYCDQQAV